MGRPIGKGKRKIDIKKIENQKARMVTFSKRRQGLFKKAQEYAQSTGSEIAILVFSPAGNPFIHGSPSFDAVIDKFDKSLSGETTGQEGAPNCENEADMSGFLQGFEEKMNSCRNVEELTAVMLELEEFRDRVSKRLKHVEEDNFVTSLLSF